MKKNLAILILLVGSSLAFPTSILIGDAVAGDWIDNALELPDATAIRDGVDGVVLDSYGPIPPGNAGDPDGSGDGLGTDVSDDGAADADRSAAVAEVLSLRSLLILLMSSSWLMP